MTSTASLAAITAALERLGITHMIAGSFASTYHGVPRTTHDIDIVIDCDRNTLLQFVRALPSERFYVSEEAALQAYRDRTMFNVIDKAAGWKIDLVLRKDRAFSREELARRTPATISGVEVPVATAEDTILTKLEWAQASGSERQIADVRGILDNQGDRLDIDYIERWAVQLGIDALWRQVAAAGVAPDDV